MWPPWCNHHPWPTALRGPGMQPFSQPHPPLCPQALVGDQYGPCPVPRRIEEKEWEVLRAQLSTRPRDLELLIRCFRRDENSVPPSYVLQAVGNEEATGPDEPTLTSALRTAAQEAQRLGLISQEQWQRYHHSGEQGPSRGCAPAS